MSRFELPPTYDNWRLDNGEEDDAEEENSFVTFRDSLDKKTRDEFDSIVNKIQTAESYELGDLLEAYYKIRKENEE